MHCSELNDIASYRTESPKSRVATFFYRIVGTQVSPNPDPIPNPEFSPNPDTNPNPDPNPYQKRF
jgi:hypothetical protein